MVLVILPSEYQKTLQFGVNRKAFVSFSDFCEYTITQMTGVCLCPNLSISARLFADFQFFCWLKVVSAFACFRLIIPYHKTALRIYTQSYASSVNFLFFPHDQGRIFLPVCLLLIIPYHRICPLVSAKNRYFPLGL